MGLKYDTSKVTLELDKEKCIACSMCLEVCPHAVFILETNCVEIKNKDRCIECGACAKNCPTEALTVKSGVGCAQAYINSFFNGGDVSCDCSPKDQNKKPCC